MPAPASASAARSALGPGLRLASTLGVVACASLLGPAIARAEPPSASAPPAPQAKGVAYTYEVENVDARADQVLVVWPRRCGSAGTPLGAVDLALNPDWAPRLHDVDYEVILQRKRHELSGYCAATARFYALPTAAFPRALREAGADDRELGQTLGVPHSILPALDAIDRKQRLEFFAHDARALRSAFKFDALAVRAARASLAAPLNSIHDVLSVEGFEATSFRIVPKRAIYTYADGASETLDWKDELRPDPTRAPALLAPAGAGADADVDASASAGAAARAGASASAGASARADAGPSATAAAPLGPAGGAPVDKGSRWVYAAAVAGLIAGGLLAYLRKKPVP
jgi:hypothetical protein